MPCISIEFGVPSRINWQALLMVHQKDINLWHCIEGIDRYSRLANVFDWLENAGLIFKIPIIQTAEHPLSAYTEEGRFKLFVFDVGMLGALSGLAPKTILEYQYGTYKGYFAENFIAQEFFSTNCKELYTWQDGRSEVEFVREY